MELQYEFWCPMHEVRLEGTPAFATTDNAIFGTHVVDLSFVECPRWNDADECQQEWQIRTCTVTKYTEAEIAEAAL
jgi:hypothetical protein